jgi:hypothetical protein
MIRQSFSWDSIFCKAKFLVGLGIKNYPHSSEPPGPFDPGDAAPP